MRYSCRARWFEPIYDYALLPDGIERRGPHGRIDIPFKSIAEITVYKERRLGSSRAYWACTIATATEQLRLTSGHRTKGLSVEDRTESYISFIKEFERRALVANSGIRFIDDEFRETAGIKIAGRLALGMFALMRCFTRRQAASLCGAMTRWVGPWLRGHRHARRQLGAALPDMDGRESRIVLRGMWDNIGRTFAEYAHVPELTAFSAERPTAGQVVMDDSTADRMLYLATQKQGALMFAAHLGNWEIPAMAAQTAGRTIALAYKPQPSHRMTDRLIALRSIFAGRLIEAGPAAPREMLRALHDGWLVGMLVDQHYAAGVEVSFFNHTCRVNPILARLARMNDVPVYGARAIRLADQRHRIEVVGPLEFPRDSKGKIDVQGAMQTVFSLIEGWIREHPEQWIWTHRIIR